MPKIELKIPDEFLMRVSRLGDKTDEIIPKVLEAGGKVALARGRGNLSSVIGRGTKIKGQSTGELRRALGLSPAKPKRDGSGWDIKVGFSEPRRGKGKSNAKVANILEHGKHNQPARPFMKPAKTQSKGAAIEAMKEALEREVRNL